MYTKIPNNTSFAILRVFASHTINKLPVYLLQSEDNQLQPATDIT